MPSAVVQSAIDAHGQSEGPLLPVLHAVQRELGWIPPEAISLIAKSLQLSRAEVHGVVSFYHDFRLSPSGTHTIQICRAEACQAVGARELEAHAKSSLQIDLHQTTIDGAITLAPVYCLGNCACGPSIRIDDDIHARVGPDKFDALLRQLGMERDK